MATYPDIKQIDINSKAGITEINQNFEAVRQALGKTDTPEASSASLFTAGGAYNHTQAKRIVKSLFISLNTDISSALSPDKNYLIRILGPEGITNTNQIADTNINSALGLIEFSLTAVGGYFGPGSGWVNLSNYNGQWVITGLSSNSKAILRSVLTNGSIRSTTGYGYIDIWEIL